MASKRKLLVITYNFPPFGTAGGSIRTVKHIKFLNTMGWECVVLAPDRFKRGNWTVQPNSAGLLEGEIPSGVRIVRTGARSIEVTDASQGQVQLTTSLFTKIADRAKKRLIKFLKHVRISSYVFPDAEIPWAISAIPTGYAEVRKSRIDVIYAVAPPITSLVIGWLISLISRKPLVVDYKDDRVGVDSFYDLPKIVQYLHQVLEKTIVRRAQFVVAATTSSQSRFRLRYPAYSSEKFVLIPNGADLDEYRNDLGEVPTSAQSKDMSKFVIVNGGGYAPTYRNASSFFKAIAQVIGKRPEFANLIRIKFIGNGAFSFYGDVLYSNAIDGILEEIPTLGRTDFVATLRSADLLLLIQTLGYPTSVAGTFYEYWAAGYAPILAIGEPGNMRDLLVHHNLGIAVDHDDVQGIAAAIEELIDAKLTGNSVTISSNGVQDYDRKLLARKLDIVLRDALERSIGR